MEFAFSKYSGCGNDFIMIDNRSCTFPSNNAALISRLCRRPEGIGADGLILMEASRKADFKMRIFNSDGKEAEMCGNGLRCFNKFLLELGFTSPFHEIETMERKLQVRMAGENVKASMGDPKDIRMNILLLIDGKEYIVHYLDTGVPHAICFVDCVDDLPVNTLGREIRFHPIFQQKGANANFVHCSGASSLSIRTYERGVEQETLACGTGATAAAIAAYLKFKMKPPISVRTKSGESLTIDFTVHENQITNVTQSGPAMYHFKGSFALSKEDLCQ